MRLLFLTHRMPFPPNKGDKIRSFHILRYLAKLHEVYLACLVDDENDLRFVPEVGKGVQRVVYARVHPRTQKLLALRALLRSSPITVDYFYSRALQRKIDDVIDDTEIDAFVCFSSPMAEYLFRSRHAGGKVRRAVRVMDLIDVDSYKWRQYAENSSAWTSWIYRLEARYLAEYEGRVARAFDRVLVVSEHEKAVFPEIGNVQNLNVMSNGVDVDFFRPVQFESGVSGHHTLVFTGVMDYWPNIDGIKWFVESVFPRVQGVLPDVALFIVGSKPTKDVERLGRVRGVIITGFVEDVRVYLARANVCIVPLRVARGIQNKVLEAMAMGKAVVCTPQAQVGIRAKPDEEIIVAEGEEAYATAIISLLQDTGRAEQLGVRARKCVEVYYGWDENLRQLDQILAARPRTMEPPEMAQDDPVPGHVARN
jgi:sugar transferase (PEP-CTERM/EpsH1 system associated)